MSVGLTSGPPRNKPVKPRRGAQSTATGKDNFHQSMRGFLDLVRRQYPDELVTITQPVEPKFDIASMVFELQAKGRFPVLFFEHMRGFDRPVVTLYGPTHIAWTETYHPRAVHLQKKVDCGPCQRRVCPLDHRCMTRLTPAEVYAAAERLLH